MTLKAKEAKMTVKIKRVDGNTEIFTAENYIIGQKKFLHPAILEVRVYAGSRMIARQKRHFQKIYKKFFYKPVVQELTPVGV